MNGAYTRILHSGVWTVECDFTDAEARCTVVEKKRVELENDNQYHFFRYSKCNKACPNLVRSIFLLRDKRGDIMKNTVLEPTEAETFNGGLQSGFKISGRTIWGKYSRRITSFSKTNL